MKTTFRFLTPLLLFLVSSGSSRAQSPAAPVGAAILPQGSRLAIIGDSITEQKLYSKFMETYLLACAGRTDLRVFQYGWSGETAGGFANRAENDILGFNPTVATTCYGMNDGAYRPFEAAIGKNYETTMRAVVAHLQAGGVKTVVLGTPGAVDTHYFKDKGSFPAGESANGYNDSLARLGEIDRRLAGELGQPFADVHGPMIEAMAKAKAALGDAFDVCGRDGVHPGPNGHLIMAYALLKGLGLDGAIGSVTIDMKGPATLGKETGHTLTGSGAGQADLESTRYPFCFDADPKNSASTSSLLPFFSFNQDLNRFVLRVTNLDAAKAAVTWGAETHEFTREQLAAGVNLAAAFSQTPFETAFKEVMNAVAAKQAFETVMIKGFITNFRAFKTEMETDPELAKALQTARERLMARQQQLDEAVRTRLVPVKHTLTVKAL
ncbi:MAG: SGNH/GDSL hydrolase family protein [Akkermansiaceae bacterium]|nr:SGNH/GDSL hydrolase family protein [Akkermansiaceae bacterium]